MSGDSLPALASFRLITFALLLACGDPANATHPLDASGASTPATPDAAVDASAVEPVAATDAAASAADPSDAELDSATPVEPPEFESVTTTLDDGEILIEKVLYLSDGLRVVGQVCRPNPAGVQGAGPFPVHVVNHGGFAGLPDWNGGNCADIARRGYVAAESSYRGEDGSEGQVEVCLGEVTDVLRLTEIVGAQPYADPERMLMSGISHGGCITLRALQRGAPVKLAIDIFGPTDWARAYLSWKAALANGTTLTAGYQGLVSALEQATGGGPDAFPEAYAVRSPLHYGAELDVVPVPLLIVQGTADAYVPPAQACALADTSGMSARYHVTMSGAVQASPPDGCADSTSTWLPGPRPSASWPNDRTLIVYDGVGHNFEGIATSYLIADMTAFLGARFPP